MKICLRNVSRCAKSGFCIPDLKNVTGDTGFSTASCRVCIMFACGVSGCAFDITILIDGLISLRIWTLLFPMDIAGEIVIILSTRFLFARYMQILFPDIREQNMMFWG